MTVKKILLVFPILISLSHTFPNGNAFYQDTSRGGRITGGSEAARNQFPYIVAFFIYTDDGQSLCGGSILSSTFVLSAAHCFTSFESADLLAGIHNILEETAAYELEVFPTDIIMHAQYNRVTQLNDISLVRTNRRPITFSVSIQSLKLPARSLATTDLTGKIGRIAGWGKTSDSTNDISPRLLYIDAPVLSNAVCTTTYGNVVTATNICLSGANARSTCQGDSGGPLTTNLNGVQTHIGIVSFGSDIGCQRNYPTVFTRITSYLSWIQTNTGITIT